MKKIQKYDRSHQFTADVVTENVAEKPNLPESRAQQYAAQSPTGNQQPASQEISPPEDGQAPPPAGTDQHLPVTGRSRSDRWYDDRLIQRLDRYEESQSAFSAAQNEMREQIQELLASQASMAQRQAPQGPVSVYEALTSHEFYKSLKARVDQGEQITPGRGEPNLRSTGFKSYFAQRADLAKYATTVDTTAVPGVTQQIPGIIERPDDPRAILNYIRKIPWSRESATSRKQTDEAFYAAVETTVKTTVDGSGTAKSAVELTSVEGLMPGTYIRVTGDDEAVHRLKVVSISTLTVTVVTSSIDFKATAGKKVLFEYAGGVAEGNTKLAGSYGTENEKYTLYTLPVWLAASKQALWNTEELELLLKSTLAQRLENAIAMGCLYGPGTAPHPMGLMVYTNRLTLAWSSLDQTDDTRIDTILTAIMTKLKGNRSNVVVFVNGTDFMKILKEKDSTGQYLSRQYGYVTLGMDNKGMHINGYRVEVDDTLYEGDCLVRKAKASDIRYNPRSEGLIVGTINAQLVENKITFLRELHWTHVLHSKYDWCDVVFDAAPS